MWVLRILGAVEFLGMVLNLEGLFYKGGDPAVVSF